MAYLLALDQGTSSSRSIIFDDKGELIASAQQEFTQHFPQSGWVEHDAMEIWQSQLSTIKAVLEKARLSAQDIAGIGITNQRETTIVWHRKTGLPIGPAIVWQDRRTSVRCEQLRHQLQEQHRSKLIQEKTGLVLDPYFSATKLAWILDHYPDARAQAERGELAFGTVDTWLAWQLSEGKLHVTDVTNASRTLLWNIHQHAWDDELLELFQIPKTLLPEVFPSSYRFGDSQILGSVIPIAGIAGDQQAALFGQACFDVGMAKNTYGTGCFMLLQMGEQCIQSRSGLISTAACQTDQHHRYALEGSVFIGGAVVQWLRDNLQIIGESSQVEALANSVPDSDGVIFVPAFAGLGAPYWKAEAKGALFGLHRGTRSGHIARAAVESIAFQSAELLLAMQSDSGTPISELRVDGGAAVNDSLLQFQADLLGIPVVRTQIVETTALGAAYLAGIALGIFANTQACAALWREQKRFLPTISREKATDTLKMWQKTIQRLL